MLCLPWDGRGWPARPICRRNQSVWEARNRVLQVPRYRPVPNLRRTRSSLRITPVRQSMKRYIVSEGKGKGRGSSRFDKKLEVKAEHFVPDSRIWLRTRGKRCPGGDYQSCPGEEVPADSTALAIWRADSLARPVHFVVALEQAPARGRVIPSIRNSWATDGTGGT
jgi:hypothetical protein